MKFAIAVGGCAVLVIVMLFVEPPGTMSKIPNLLHLTQPTAANTVTSTTAPPSATITNPPHTCKCVAFRLDDIQDYFLTKPQMQVINVFSERNASLTIGVIGNYFGNDSGIVDFVRVAKNNNSKVEVANHGWNHEDFSVLSKAEQSQLMAKTNKKIYDLLDVKPVTFITPYEKLDNDTFAAARENGIQYISSDVINDPPPYDIYDNNAGLHRFPQTALTGNVNGNGTQWIEYAPEEVLEDVHDSLD
ncbi:MAG TPA: polysaccharide deacetylase family protein, partial [Nitrososphaera sp.]|nr:polysaccharide deacetylase family protein [Nitrososphaera sp.]